MPFFRSIEPIRLDKRPSSSSPSPSVDSRSTEKANRFIQALNNNEEDEASRIVRSLAKGKVQVQFALDMITESENTTPRQPPKPIVEPLKY